MKLSCRCPEKLLRIELLNMSLILKSTPEELRAQFSSLTTRKDIASLLEIEISKFTYYVYGIPEDKHYHVFTVRKNLGGFREISAPITPIKILQRKLNQVLQVVYKPKSVVHSYIKGSKRNILTNAEPHVNAALVLNIDLKDFFPSINFGRVQGLFLHPPFNFNKVVSTTLAKMCCYNRALPQGAPTSPIISNVICARMDRQLSKLARDYDCIYTRYADDITFSCMDDAFPESIIKSHSDKLQLGDELTTIISNNGFELNPDKVKLRTKFERQVVTGVVTNVFPNVRREYIRKVRAMLHAWSKYGLSASEAEFRAKYDRKHRIELKGAVSFKDVVKGKIDYIAMVKGKDDSIYLYFRQKLRELSPDLVKNEETPLEFLIRTSRTTPTKSIVSSVRSATGDVHMLPSLLASVDAGLESKRLGVWQTFYGNSNDRLGQAAHSMREVIRLLLNILAPEEKIKECPWYNKPTDSRTDVTRRMRVRYCLSGSSTSVSTSTLNYIDSLSKFIDESYAKLSGEAHASRESDIANVKAFLQSGELLILIILLNRKV